MIAILQASNRARIVVRFCMQSLNVEVNTHEDVQSTYQQKHFY